MRATRDNLKTVFLHTRFCSILACEVAGVRAPFVVRPDPMKRVKSRIRMAMAGTNPISISLSFVLSRSLSLFLCVYECASECMHPSRGPNCSGR
jgi:hypothetical protein